MHVFIRQAGWLPREPQGLHTYIHEQWRDLITLYLISPQNTKFIDKVEFLLECFYAPIKVITATYGHKPQCCDSGWIHSHDT